jgi:hypothetical protein
MGSGDEMTAVFDRGGLATRMKQDNLRQLKDQYFNQGWAARMDRERMDREREYRSAVPAIKPLKPDNDNKKNAKRENAT